MNGRVEISGDVVRKRLSDAHAAERLVARTDALRRAGVPTPEVRSTDRTGEVTFDRIEGQNGLERVIQQGEGALRPIVDALAPIHGAAIPGLSPFDPTARIWQRVAEHPEPWIQSWLRSYMPRTTAKGTVHGDFHAGQVICASTGKVWIVDLDDLAIGPPEADLGNFAAHLATRPETRRGDALAGFDHWLVQVLAHRAAANHALADQYGRIALLRRALKLAEHGDDSVLAVLRQA